MANSDRLNFEQAVYGSFPFWDKGYGILASSPGCQPEWLEEFQAVCRKYGEPTRDASAVGAMFSLRLPSGPWLIVRVDSQGDDDHGRPGALAFHGLFVAHGDFRRARFDPFLFDELPRRVWDRETTSLAAGSLPLKDPEGVYGTPNEEALHISRALAAGRNVAVEAMAPVHDLARSVWQLLPARVRGRTSCATLTFSNENRFDFLAIPRLANASVDASYVGPPNFGERVVAHDHGEPPAHDLELPARWWVWAAATLLACALLGYFFTRPTRPSPDDSPPRSVAEAPPDASQGKEPTTSKDDRARALDGLIDLAERYHVLDIDAVAPSDPVRLMVMIAEQLRYRGPILAPRELHRLRSESTSESQRALDMHAQILRFLPDRPLPASFAKGKLGWQLVTFAWSFHVLHDTRRKIAEIPAEVSEALEAPADLKTGALARKFPAIARYEEFLKRLPKR